MFVCDSRLVKPGDVFVAIDGVKAKGKDFAAAAVANGAIKVVAEHPIDGLGVNMEIVPNARAFYGEACSAWYGNPSRKLDVYGITGTNGKTTTAWILAELLQALYGKGKVGYITTVEVFDGKTRRAHEHTTPDAAQLQQMFKQCVDGGCGAVVMEVSSHAAHQMRIAGTRFAGCAFTNLTEDHLDYHLTMENYFNAKAEFFRYAARTNPGATAAICIDGAYGRQMAEIARNAGLTVKTCGFTPEADLAPVLLPLDKLPLVGRYNVQNVLNAAALALGAGVKMEDIVRAIPTLTPRWGRLERVQTRSAADVFVDFAHTDDALANVLSTVREFTSGKVWCVFGAGGDRDRAKRPLMGRAAAENADCLVVTSDNPRSEDPAAIISQIVAGIPQNCNYVTEVDRRKAIFHALSAAQNGDTVVICGKGHETTQTIGSQVLPFDDRLVASEFHL